jgi:hypothetical protein
MPERSFGGKDSGRDTPLFVPLGDRADFDLPPGLSRDVDLPHRPVNGRLSLACNNRRQRMDG